MITTATAVGYSHFFSDFQPPSGSSKPKGAESKESGDVATVSNAAAKSASVKEGTSKTWQHRSKNLSRLLNVLQSIRDKNNEMIWKCYRLLRTECRI